MRKDVPPRSAGETAKMPTAKERRALRDVLLQRRLPECSEDARRRGSSRVRLSVRMERMWQDLEHCKEVLRVPKNARVRTDEDVPEPERWRSTFLLPDKTFQKTRHMLRR
jgi:hypothetical protein